MVIYKILRADEWADLQGRGLTAGSPADLADGYVHLSTAAQLPGTLAKHYAGEGPLHLLACEADRMAPDLRWEPAREGALFPHLYRPLRLTDILWTRSIAPGANGHETGPLE